MFLETYCEQKGTLTDNAERLNINHVLIGPTAFTQSLESGDSDTNCPFAIDSGEHREGLVRSVLNV